MNVKKLLKTIYPAAIVVVLYVLITRLRSFDVLNGYHIQVMMFAGVNIMMTASLNLVNGFTGQFCIGHAGFMSLGCLRRSRHYHAGLWRQQCSRRPADPRVPAGPDCGRLCGRAGSAA